MAPKLNDFEVLDIIGHGAHGTIKRVKRKSDGQILVWKELHYASMNEAEKQGLVLEVNILRELHHPNIVSFHHYLVDQRTGTLFIFMEYCSGGDLRHLVNKCRKSGSFLEEGFIWRVLKQVCEGLRACHERVLTPDPTTNHGREAGPILHRDIKPANVFLDREGNIKLGDFGLARTLSSDLSFARTFVGTPYYMSPEVIDGKEYNQQSDIWSLGCLVYELCAWEPPFKADSQRQLNIKIKAGKYGRIPARYSAALWEVIQEMLTQQDFLRPSAIMLLLHPALKANTPQETEGLEADLSASWSLPQPSLQPKNEEEERRLEESLMREVKEMMLKSRRRVEEERRVRLREGGDELRMKVLLDEDPEGEEEADVWSREEGCVDVRGCLEESVEYVSSVKRKVESPHQCGCGEQWRERLAVVAEREGRVEERERSVGEREERLEEREVSLREKEKKIEERERVAREKEARTEERERSVREREGTVREREARAEESERSLAKRERRVHAMEQDAKQHLVRAQVYLKQSRSSRAPKPDSCCDATTEHSAGLGSEAPPTVAFLDTQAGGNPFLRMRASRGRLGRSNTIDNPKSRRKHGDCFYLDENGGGGWWRGEGGEEGKRWSHHPDLWKEEGRPSGGGEAKGGGGGGNGSVEPPQHGTDAPVCPLPAAVAPPKDTITEVKAPHRHPKSTFLTTLRENLTRRPSTRKAKPPAEKENEGVFAARKTSAKGKREGEGKRAPLRAVNISSAKRFESKGVCAKPQVRLKPPSPLITPTYSKTSTLPANQHNVLRFYNAV